MRLSAATGAAATGALRARAGVGAYWRHGHHWISRAARCPCTMVLTDAVACRASGRRAAARRTRTHTRATMPRTAGGRRGARRPTPGMTPLQRRHAGHTPSPSPLPGARARARAAPAAIAGSLAHLQHAGRGHHDHRLRVVERAHVLELGHVGKSPRVGDIVLLADVVVHHVDVREVDLHALRRERRRVVHRDGVQLRMRFPILVCAGGQARGRGAARAREGALRTRRSATSGRQQSGAARGRRA